MFHQINNDNRKFYQSVPNIVFEKICWFISKYFSVIHISEIEEYFKKTNKPAVVISFDDGHYDIIKNALPVLKKYNLKFNVNIDTEILETNKPQDFVRVYDILNQIKIVSYHNNKYMNRPITIDYNNSAITEANFTEILGNLNKQERRSFTEQMYDELCDGFYCFSKMISKEDFKELLENNIEIGSHGHSHTLLTKITEEEVFEELNISKNILEKLTGKNCDIIAYPNGLYNEKVEKIATKIGYKYFLRTDDKINIINKNNLNNYFYRINMYHRTFEECIANMFGFHKMIKKI